MRFGTAALILSVSALACAVVATSGARIDTESVLAEPSDIAPPATPEPPGPAVLAGRNGAPSLTTRVLAESLGNEAPPPPPPAERVAEVCARPTPEVRGLVVDPEGRGVGDVVVAANFTGGGHCGHEYGSEARETTTDALGRFQLDVVEPHSHVEIDLRPGLRWIAPPTRVRDRWAGESERGAHIGCADGMPVEWKSRDRHIVTPPGGRLPWQGQPFVLQPAQTIAGFVVDPDGHPAGEAIVVASVPTEGVGAFNEPAVIRTDVRADAAGRFEIGVPVGAESVRLRAIGMGEDGGMRFVEGVRAGDRDVQVRLERLATISGEVVDAQGEPVESGWLSLWDAGSSRWAEPLWVGDFSPDLGICARVPPGTYRLTYGPRGGSTRGPGVASTIVTAPSAGLSLVCPRRDFRSGWIRDPGSLGFWVTWIPAHGIPSPPVERAYDCGALAGEDGEFTLVAPNVGGGLYVRRPGDRRFALLEDVRFDDSLLEVRLVDGLSISGRAEPCEAPLPAGARVRATRGGLVQEGDVQPDGSFSVTGLPPGAYDLRLIGSPKDCGPILALERAVVAGATGVVLSSRRSNPQR